MISKEENIIILTPDLRLNQTFTNRYLSFYKALSHRGISCKCLGLSYPFKPYFLQDLAPSESVKLNTDFEILKIKKLNIIQVFISLIDKYSLPFLIKKLFLALHIILFKIDQWLVKESNFNALEIKPTIIISGGSGGIHQSAAKLAAKYNAKLILDYRDPWNFGYHLLETNQRIYNFKRFFTLKKELKILHQANHIITVSHSLKRFFPEELQYKVTVIENGSNYEQKDVESKIIAIPPLFSIIYLGTIYDDQLRDESFFESLTLFINLNNIKSSQLKVLFIGADKNLALPKVITKYHLNPFVEITPRLTQEEILPFLLNASIFLHLKYGNRSKIITSKNADYLQFRKPILLPSNDFGDLAESINENKAGYICNNKQEVLKVLSQEFEKFLNKEITILKQPDLKVLSRTEVSKKLIKVIEDLKN